MRELGIAHNVEKLVDNMNLGNFPTMEWPTYAQPTIDFIASMEYVTYGGSGVVRFNVGPRKYCIMLKTFCEVYRIPEMGYQETQSET